MVIRKQLLSIITFGKRAKDTGQFSQEIETDIEKCSSIRPPGTGIGENCSRAFQERN